MNLIERLVECSGAPDVVQDAIDEIKRLSAENATLKAFWDKVVTLATR